MSWLDNVPPKLIRIVVQLANPDEMRRQLQFATNEVRMAQSEMLWIAQEAAVGICPGRDDFLVWLDREKPAEVVPTTAEAVADFRQSVMPQLQEWRAADDRVRQELYATEIEALLAICTQVRERGITSRDELTDLLNEQSHPPTWARQPSAKAAAIANRRVVVALTKFLERYKHEPDRFSSVYV